MASLVIGVPRPNAPRFLVMDRQPPRPAAILLAILTAAGALYGSGLCLRHSRAPHFHDTGSGTTRTPNGKSGSPPRADDEEKEDPDQVDTIVLGDPADAPMPARRGSRYSPVHPTILIHLPRFGEQSGLIPDSLAGHLLYRWLAAFNQSSGSALADVLPNDAPESTAAAQLELRQQTGGFNLLSAKEVQPGLLVFRLRDQTPAATEALGTLQMLPNSNPQPSAASASAPFCRRVTHHRKHPWLRLPRTANTLVI